MNANRTVPEPLIVDWYVTFGQARRVRELLAHYVDLRAHLVLHAEAGVQPHAHIVFGFGS